MRYTNLKKIRLNKFRGLPLTKEIEDFISLDDSETSPRALMPCGHAVGSSSMTNILNSIV